MTNQDRGSFGGAEAHTKGQQSADNNRAEELTPFHPDWESWSVPKKMKKGSQMESS